MPARAGSGNPSPPFSQLLYAGQNQIRNILRNDRYLAFKDAEPLMLVLIVYRIWNLRSFGIYVFKREGEMTKLHSVMFLVKVL